MYRINYLHYQTCIIIHCEFTSKHNETVLREADKRGLSVFIAADDIHNSCSCGAGVLQAERLLAIRMVCSLCQPPPRLTC